MARQTRKTASQRSFDLKRELRKISTKTFTFSALMEKLREIRFKNLAVLPPEYGTHEMLITMMNGGWLKPRKRGKRNMLVVCVN